ncbi:DUF4402 domain-containing protein [Flavobacterium sp. 14A]|uniref:DUF4402 domain-containing protein n=1 Tax=Flavobacterium sp. 14A TaxID=2735896 RepID=UPI00156D6E7B|nr:DUF4402 domain-containing protein [Flavobacterium sp. 14A]NRT13230.1 hypothetical protein [Flavobacterium sp. 14A]
MKKITLFAILAFAAFSSSAYAQTVVSGAATATATIITPIAITKVVDMNFGDISTNGNNGTVKLTTEDIRSATGGASFSAATPGTITSAKFTVTGMADYGYSISMPGTITLKHTDNSTVMVVTDINNSVGTSGTLAAGTQDIFVGGTLNLVGAQLAGVYTNTADLKVTVNYN